jgi:DNA-binding CsgD family transcriptional regulator/tetratricopeptide (TPR) repeat protein
MSATPISSPETVELLERSDQLALLAESLAAVKETGCGRLVFVAGEAGVGKTALLRRFAEDLADAPRVLWGACDPLFTPRPLGPFFEIAEAVGGELERVVGEGAKPYEVVAELVRELGQRAPTVLVLEDVHWADEATLDVLRLLARRVETVPALVLASYRDDELDRAQPLRIVVGELATSPSTRRVTLEPLSGDAVATLAEPYRVNAVELHERTGGNPFFATEVLAGTGDEIPATVRDAVLARAARLGPEAKRVLEAIAVVPQQTELWLLDALAGDDAAHVEECLGSGMLRPDADAVVFRHELARLAVEESLAPRRRLDLNRKALAAITAAPGDVRDPARLAHHAEAAGDVDAVLRFAPAAAERAASLGAHREAAAQYARAIRFSDHLPADERADLLERYAQECLLTDQYDDGIAALERALEHLRTLGNRLKEGEVLCQLSTFLWCPGRTIESERAVREAVALLEALPPGRELAWAYANLAQRREAAMRFPEAVALARRGLELAERLGEEEIAVNALGTIGICEEGYDRLEEALHRAQRADLEEHVARIFIYLVLVAVSHRRHDVAAAHLEPGLGYCDEHGLELLRLYLLAWRARLELDQGRWSEAADSAAAVLRIPRTSTTPRILSLVVLALVRARRGDPEVWPLLDEAWALAEPTGELPRIGPVALARAEAAWLEGRAQVIDAETDAALDLARRRRARWFAGELACWRRRVGLDGAAGVDVAEPCALELAGDHVAAADAWARLGCPYESALALAHADDGEAVRRAHDELQALGALPAAVIVARRLRERGVRGLPRGPRPATRANAAGLTARELEVLALVASGLHNSEIAERLVLSPKTVDHHVSAILRKLGVRTRGQAAAEAARLDLVAAR